MRETKARVVVPGMEDVEKLLKRNKEIIDQLYTNLGEIENLTSRMEVTLLVRDESEVE